ncbi:hypothetical protein [Gimesia aquarii]|uniref:Uncharacterized protein n=1 Tax=Gimesia aquarii TaxID=2527964 RepID=A0A517VXI2_9PLAN|nr:hypothetical protein [Gimesia aquarii]QDT97708.1 hypothetical protein V144x_31890 [Gimesia aquarii]
MSKTVFLGIALIILGTTIGVSAADMENAECKPVGGWQCHHHGPNKCARLEREGSCAGGTCDMCLGTTTYPPKMCFYKEGETCPRLAPVNCGTKHPGTCDPDDCGCSINITVTDGTCTFSSC